MKLRAEFTIDVEAEDYISAAEHQRRLQCLAEQIRNDFPAMSFNLRERRRARTATTSQDRLHLVRTTGALHLYEEA